MSEPFIGEIKMFAGNFAPKGYAQCDGTLLSIRQNTALFALLGTTYGGNGTDTFGLPDMRGRVPTGTGTGPGLSSVLPGETGGVDTLTLTVGNLPAHNHTAVFAGLGAPSASVDIAVGTSASAALVNPTAGSAVYLTAVEASYGTDSVTLKGLYSTTAPPESPAPAKLGGVKVSGSTPTGTVTVALAGSSQPFDLHQPYLGITFIIALLGEFPSRS